MHQSDNLTPLPASQGTQRNIPGVLWIGIVALGVVTLLTLISGVSRGSAAACVAAGFNSLILVGLLLGYRWAYILLMVFSIAGVAVALSRSGGQGLAVLLGNCIVVVPVLLSTHYFSGPSPQEISPQHSPNPEE